MYTDLHVVIPTAGRRNAYLTSIINNIDLPPDNIVIVRDPAPEGVNGATEILRDPEINIHRWWNLGIQYAEGRNGRFVALLSDDVALQPGQLQIMFQEMEIWKPAILASRESNGGYWGHAFLIDIASGVRPDEEFRWWFGDLDLRKQAMRSGGFLYSSQEIFHLEPNKMTSESAELRDLADGDERVWFKKYPLEKVKALFPRAVHLLKRARPTKPTFHIS